MTNNSSSITLLKIQEQLTENYSSPQIIKTLDNLLFNALQPLMLNSDFVDYVLVELLPHVFLNQRRKFSNVLFQELRDNLFSVVMIEDRVEKIKLLRKQNLERSVFFALLVAVEKQALLYLAETNKQLNAMAKGKPVERIQLKQMQSEFFVHKDMYQTSQSVIFWLKQAFRFKQMIVEKYTRHAIVEANKMVASTNLQIDPDDLSKDLILAIHKAIDKYDSEKGPLTSYVNTWFMEAKTNYRNAHEYGVAYNMPTGKRKKMIDEGSAKSITLELNDAVAESTQDDTQDTLANLISQENSILTNNLVCRVDKQKLYCLTQGIQYTLTENDIEVQNNNRIDA